MMRFGVFLLVLCAGFLAVKAAGLKEEFTWSFINYAWPENNTVCEPIEPSTPQGNAGSDFVFPSYQAPKRGYFSFRNRFGEDEETPEYNAENNIPMGATRYKNKIFVTVPRRRVGIPATLSYVPLDCKGRHNVPLMPYPSWELNALNAQRPQDPTDVATPLVSVYRTTVDACDRLWFVDMGMLEYPTGRQQIQQFALVVMDLKTDKIIRRFPFSVDDVNAAATLASVTVDVTKDNCNDAYAYIPDLSNYKMMVYSWRQNEAWRVSHNYFFLDPLQGEFNIGGQTFQWNDGIFSVILSKVGKDGYRTAYFHPMAGTKEFSVSTRVLRDRAMATRSYHGQDFKVVGDRGMQGQSSTHEMHEPTGVMFLGEVNKNGLYCWNTNKPFRRENHGLIQQDAAKMIYPSDVKIDNMNNVWMMTNSMPVFLYGTLNYEEINFRIWTNSIREAIAGTPCV